MQEAYRLLRESLWFLEAEVDPDYSPHTLSDQRERLKKMIEHQLQAMEADQEWSSQHDDSIFLVQKLPEGWLPKVQEPSRQLRFTARGPVKDGVCLVVLADSPDSLARATH